MAYVPGCAADVFISYAHVDNQEMGGWRWVSEFADALNKRLDQELGVSTGTVRVWMDHQINGSQPLTEQLLRSIDGSATLLCVVSAAYLGSQWCALEWSRFLELRQRRGGRVFFVVIRDIQRETLPQTIRALDLPMYAFWKRHPETKLDYTVGTVDDPAEHPIPQIYRQLARLSVDLKNELKRLREAAPGAPALPDSGASPREPLSAKLRGQTIYLAEVTDDLDELRDGVRTYLEQHSATILPAQWYPTREPQTYAAAVRTDLERSVAFVQLLGGSRGREKSAELPLGLPGLQHALAVELGRPMHRWRAQDLALERISTDEWRQFLLGTDVTACPIEEFKSLLLRAFEPRAARPPPSTGVMVYVNSDRCDEDVVARLIERLKELQVTAFKPFWNQSVKEFNRERKELLSLCHGIMHVYGHSGPTWVRRQIFESARVLVERRQPVRGLALCDAPPEGKPALEVALPNFRTIDCRAGIDRQALSDFVHSLAG